MNSWTRWIGWLTGFAMIAGGVSFFLHSRNAELREQIAGLRRNADVNRQARAAAVRRQELEGLAHTDKDRAAAELRAEVDRARTKVAELEHRAEERRAQQAARLVNDDRTLMANRDPRHGMVRLENYVNAGQATPMDAFQTLVWATMKGDNSTLVHLFYFSSTARAKAEAWIASLPGESQPQWTPEKLAALLFADLLTPVPAIQITGETLNEADTATVQLRLPGDDEEKVKFRLTAAGWRLLVSDSQIEKAKKRIAIIPAGMPP